MSRGERKHTRTVSKEEESCADWQRTVTIGTKLSAGTFGQVNQACRGENCDLVVKKSLFQNEEDKQVFLRDVSYLQELNGTPVTPKLIDAKYCEDKGFIVLEQFSGDLWSIAGKRMPGVVLLTSSELQQIKDLAIQLGKLGVIHGDLKLNQFLLNQKTGKIVITDFGFASYADGNPETVVIHDKTLKMTNWRPSFGWSSKPEERGGFECSFNVPKKPSNTSKVDWATQVNLYQLELSLIVAHTVVEQVSANKILAVFYGFDEVTSETRSILDKRCGRGRGLDEIIQRRLATTLERLKKPEETKTEHKKRMKDLEREREEREAREALDRAELIEIQRQERLAMKRELDAWKQQQEIELSEESTHSSVDTS